MGVPRAAQSPFKQNAAAPTVGAPRPGVPSTGGGPGKIQLNYSLENVEESGLLTVGKWPAYVESVEEITASTGSQGIQFNLRFVSIPTVATNNPNEGKGAKHTVYVTPKALWKVKNSFCAVGQCDTLMEFDSEAAIRVLVEAEVTEESYTPEGQDTPRKSTKADTIHPWPIDKGGPGTKFPVS